MAEVLLAVDPSAGERSAAQQRQPQAKVDALGARAAFATIDAIWIRAGMAHDLGTRLENGRTMGYHVYFARDAKGLWKVLQF